MAAFARAPGPDQGWQNFLKRAQLQEPSSREHQAFPTVVDEVTYMVTQRKLPWRVSLQYTEMDDSDDHKQAVYSVVLPHLGQPASRAHETAAWASLKVLDDARIAGIKSLPQLHMDVHQVIDHAVLADNMDRAYRAHQSASGHFPPVGLNGVVKGYKLSQHDSDIWHCFYAVGQTSLYWGTYVEHKDALQAYAWVDQDFKIALYGKRL